MLLSIAHALGNMLKLAASLSLIGQRGEVLASRMLERWPAALPASLALGAMLALNCSAAAPAAAAAPATSSSRPATSATSGLALDRSDPIAAAKALFNAISAGDRAGVGDSLYAADEPQRKLASAMADLIVNGRALGNAAQARFGKAGDSIGRGMLNPSDLSRLDAAKEQINGDAAVVSVAGQSRPMSFRRGADGNWRLVVTDFGAAAPENIERQTALVQTMAEAMQSSADEIAAGKYSTPDAARLAIQQKLHAAMISFNRPATTHAATQPVR
jgi:hypothetical protein